MSDRCKGMLVPGSLWTNDFSNEEGNRRRPGRCAVRGRREASGALLRQGNALLLVGPKGRDRFPKAGILRDVSAAEALQLWGLSIPKSACAHVLRHTT